MGAAEQAIAKALVDAGASDIDFAAVQDAVKAEQAAQAKAAEAAAAEAEGLLPMPADLVPLRDEKLKLDEQIDELTAKRDAIKDTFGKRLQEAGMVGFLLNGKVHARRSNRTRTDIDRKRLKEELPDVYKNYLKTTGYTAIVIN